MSQAVQAALPWIVCAIAAAILIPGIIDFLRKKKPDANASEKDRTEQLDDGGNRRWNVGWILAGKSLRQRRAWPVLGCSVGDAFGQ